MPCRLGPAEMRPHRLEGDVQIPLDRVLVRDDPNVERRVALLDVRLQHEAVALLERRFAEATRDEREEAGHEVCATVVELAPRSASVVRSRSASTPVMS